MNWKTYYEAELRQEGCRERIAEWLRLAHQRELSDSSDSRRTILSIPHTAIDYSGPLQARVIARLAHQGVRRVIALGVLHGSMVPEYRLASDGDAPLDDRLAAIDCVSGAFYPTAKLLNTPFGSLDVASMPTETSREIRLDSTDLLRREFSLDTFHSMLRLAVDVFQIAPIPVLPLYVGMTRHPVTGSFDVAASLAAWLQDQWDAGTAIVTTGDVVHYGAFYGSQDHGSATESLTTLFRERLDELFDAAFVRRDFESAYQMSLQVLKSDQREILPILAHLLEGTACASVEAFELSDYAAVLDSAPPCLVASALIAYKS